MACLYQAARRSKASSLESIERFRFFPLRIGQLGTYLEQQVDGNELVAAGISENLAEYWDNATSIADLKSRKSILEHYIVTCAVDQNGELLPVYDHRVIGLAARIKKRRWSLKKRDNKVEGFVVSNAMATDERHSISPTVPTLLFEIIDQASQLNHGNVQISASGGSIERYTAFSHAAAAGWHALTLCERDSEDPHIIRDEALHRCA